MSWNIKLIGIRENVKAAVLADSQIPPALKEAIAMTIEAGTGDPNVQLDLDGVRVESSGYYDATSAYSSINQLQVEPIRLARPPAKSSP